MFSPFFSGRIRALLRAKVGRMDGQMALTGKITKRRRMPAKPKPNLMRETAFSVSSLHLRLDG